MESNCFMIGPGIKEIWAIKGLTPTSGNTVELRGFAAVKKCEEFIPRPHVSNFRMRGAWEEQPKTQRAG